MASSSSVVPAPSAAFLRAFDTAAVEGCLTFERFMELALYHPEVGYYRQPRRRVGYGGETDFYTATTSGAIFGELVAAAAARLLEARGGSPAAHEFVEVGAEDGRTVLDGVTHPFASLRGIAVGEPLVLTGSLVVFSNELFDAQPCARFVRTETGWSEVMVRRRGDALEESLRPLPEPPADLPLDVPAGYRFDAPRQAVRLLRDLAGQPWRGLLLAFDYGKSYAELATETPQGTARAYHRHRQSNDLLAQPGEQDLTCHVCWDWLVDSLRHAQFAVDPIASQETFLVKQAGSALEAMMAQEAGTLSPRKRSLLQLLHPAHLGRKFQVLSGWRS